MLDKISQFLAHSPRGNDIFARVPLEIGIFLFFDPSKTPRKLNVKSRNLEKARKGAKSSYERRRKKEERKKGRKEGRKEGKEKRGIVRWQRRVSGYELRTVQR